MRVHKYTGRLEVVDVVLKAQQIRMAIAVGSERIGMWTSFGYQTVPRSMAARLCWSKG
jgi:hypothetical protein